MILDKENGILDMTDVTLEQLPELPALKAIMKGQKIDYGKVKMTLEQISQLGLNPNELLEGKIIIHD